MKNCSCGKEVRLRAYKISINRKRGVGHYIEHMDGTPVCVEGSWSCAALKPYPKIESERESRKMMSKWEKA